MLDRMDRQASVRMLSGNVFPGLEVSLVKIVKASDDTQSVVVGVFGDLVYKDFTVQRTISLRDRAHRRQDQKKMGDEKDWRVRFHFVLVS